MCSMSKKNICSRGLTHRKNLTLFSVSMNCWERNRIGKVNEIIHCQSIFISWVCKLILPAHKTQLHQTDFLQFSRNTDVEVCLDFKLFFTKEKSFWKLVRSLKWQWKSLTLPNSTPVGSTILEVLLPQKLKFQVSCWVRHFWNIIESSTFDQGIQYFVFKL